MEEKMSQLIPMKHRDTVMQNLTESELYNIFDAETLTDIAAECYGTLYSIRKLQVSGNYDIGFSEQELDSIISTGIGSLRSCEFKKAGRQISHNIPEGGRAALIRNWVMLTHLYSEIKHPPELSRRRKILAGGGKAYPTPEEAEKELNEITCCTHGHDDALVIHKTPIHEAVINTEPGLVYLFRLLCLRCWKEGLHPHMIDWREVFMPLSLLEGLS